MVKGTLRICDNGHRFYKTSDCPSCPTCQNERKPKTGFLSLLSAPSRRALENAGLTSLKKISEVKVGDLLKLHGLGLSTIKQLRALMKKEKINFNE